MPFDFTPAMVTSGRTIQIVLDMLPGAPVVHVEHLGPDNKTLLAAQVAKANTVSKKPINLGRGERSKVTAEQLTSVEDEREDLHHAIRKLEAKHTDGRDATADDIPEFIEGLPPDVVRRIHNVAANIENYRNGRFADPKATAEK